jgi:hypothetical protein
MYVALLPMRPNYQTTFHLPFPLPPQKFSKTIPAKKHNGAKADPHTHAKRTSRPADGGFLVNSPHRLAENSFALIASFITTLLQNYAAQR